MSNRISISIACLALLFLVGCATVPVVGPSVMVLPAPGKPFDEFQKDDFVCRNWAAGRIGLSPSEALNQEATLGAITGAAVGAGIGAAIGSASGDAGPGAAIGAGIGLISGLSGGVESGRYHGWRAQRRYDIAYSQCMYAKGNQVGGTKIRTKRYVRPRGGYGVPPDYRPPGNTPPQDFYDVPPDYSPAPPPK